MPMNIKIIKGNLFTSQCQTLVNTVNCVGVMGAGIALEFRLRYPEMYQRYVELCEDKLMDIGKLSLYKYDSQWILNFPTKKHWKYPSKIEYLKLGLQKFLATYQQKNITSIAFPLLGAKNGKISEEQSLEVMQKYLSQCQIPVEIYFYDPMISDNFYNLFKNRFKSLNAEEIYQTMGLRKFIIKKIQSALENPEINNFSELAEVKGIGLTSLEKSIKFISSDVFS